MHHTTSQSTEAVQKALRDNGLSPTIVHFSESTRTAQEAANAIGCTVPQIVKSLIFVTTISRAPILVLTSGSNRVNEKRIAEYVGEPIERASADLVREATGFAIGGVAPIGHRMALRTFIDADLLNFSELWAAAGTPHTVFSITPQDLERITGGEVVVVV